MALDFSMSTPIIVIVVYVIAELLKKFVLKQDKLRSLLPVLCIILGVVVAFLLYFFYPQGVNYENLVDAATSGGLSGALATSFNQIYKQFINMLAPDVNNDEIQG